MSKRITPQEVASSALALLPVILGGGTAAVVEVIRQYGWAVQVHGSVAAASMIIAGFGSLIVYLRTRNAQPVNPNRRIEVNLGLWAQRLTWAGLGCVGLTTLADVLAGPGADGPILLGISALYLLTVVCLSLAVSNAAISHVLASREENAA